MARAAVAFTPPHLFGRLEQAPEGLDLKQGGLFPLSTASGCSPGGGILETSTTGRIEAWWAGTPQPGLWHQSGGGLPAVHAASAAQPVAGGNGRVRVADLGPAERDLLRHALHQVKKFQQWLTCTFVLGNSDVDAPAPPLAAGRFGREFALLFARPAGDEWVALDFETTSLDPALAEIVSIGRCASGATG